MHVARLADTVGSVLGLQHNCGGEVHFREDYVRSCSQREAHPCGGDREHGRPHIFVLLEAFYAVLAQLHIDCAIDANLLNPLMLQVVLDVVEHVHVVGKDDEFLVVFNHVLHLVAHCLGLGLSGQLLALGEGVPDLDSLLSALPGVLGDRRVWIHRVLQHRIELLRVHRLQDFLDFLHNLFVAVHHNLLPLLRRQLCQHVLLQPADHNLRLQNHV